MISCYHVIIFNGADNCVRIDRVITAAHYIDITCFSHISEYLLTHRNMAYALAGIWAYALFWPLMPLFGWSYYTYESFGTSCTIAWGDSRLSVEIFDVMTIVFCFILHLGILVFCYYNVSVVTLRVCPIKYARRLVVLSWWRHQIETFSALLALCAGNSPVAGEFPTQRSVKWSFDVFFDLRLNKLLSKQSWV